MYGEMMGYYGLTKDLEKAEYFETEAFNKTFLSVRTAISSGGIIAMTGMVGSGKTTALRRMQQILKEDNKLVFSKSLATDRRQVTVNTLYYALFSDLPTEKGFKIPTQHEKRERILQELIWKVKKPVVLFIDEAHDLHTRTLIGLKHLIETVEEAKGTLAIVVVGHPKLGNELRKPNMEEVGARAKIFNLDAIEGSKSQYIEWILDKCSQPGIKPDDIVSQEAIELLAERLVTPLQITHYLTLAFEKGFETGLKPIDTELIETVLAPDLYAIGPRLARHGYSIAALCEHLNAKPSAVRSYLCGQLEPGKTEEFNREIHKLGIL